MKTKKLFLWAITAMMTMVLPMCVTSCSTEDNPLPTGKATITVNTGALYEELGVTDDVLKAFDRYRSFEIRGTVLIYDENGNLVKEITGSTRQLEPMTIDVSDVLYGTYTLVAVQYPYYTADDDPFTMLNDIDKLSTAHFEYDRTYRIEAQDAVGFCSETVTLDGTPIEATITPKAAGSIIDMRMDGITENKDFDIVELYSHSKVIGFYLDPSLSVEERTFFDDYDGMLFGVEAYNQGDGTNMWCGKGFTLNYGKDIEYELWCGSVDSVSAKTRWYYYTSYYPYLTSGNTSLVYYDFNDWNLNWQYNGPVEEFDDWMAAKLQTPLTLKPYLEWGCSLDDVIAHSNATLGWYYSTTNGQLEPYDGYWDEVLRIGVNLYAFYGFETQDGQNLQYVYYYNGVENVSIDHFTSSLASQGYTFLEVEQFDDYTAYTYLSADGKTMVTAEEYETAWAIWYKPVPEDVALLRASRFTAPGKHFVTPPMPSAERQKSVIGGERKKN